MAKWEGSHHKDVQVDVSNIRLSSHFNSEKRQLPDSSQWETYTYMSTGSCIHVGENIHSAIYIYTHKILFQRVRKRTCDDSAEMVIMKNRNDNDDDKF